MSLREEEHSEGESAELSETTFPMPNHMETEASLVSGFKMPLPKGPDVPQIGPAMPVSSVQQKGTMISDSKAAEMELPVLESVVPPDGGWGWMVLLGTMTANIVVVGHAKSFGVYIRHLMVDFDSSPSKISWVHSLHFFTYCCSAPFVSVLGQVIGPRRIGVFGGLLSFIGLTTSAFAPSIECIFFLLGAIQGLSAACTFTSGISAIAKYFHRRKGLANGLTVSGNALGGIIMPLVVNYLISEYSSRGCFLIMGSIILHACAGAMLWQPVEWHKKCAPSELKESNERAKGNQFSSSNLETVGVGKNEQLLLCADQSVMKENFSDSIPKTDEKNFNSWQCNFHSNEPNTDTRITRRGSFPYMSKVYTFDDKSIGSVCTASLSTTFKHSPKLLNSVRASSFMCLSSDNFGSIPGTIVAPEHLVVTGEAIETTAHCRKTKLLTLACIQKLKVSLTIFEKSRFYFISISLFFHILGYNCTIIFLPYNASLLGFSESQAASLLSVFALMDLTARIFCSWLSDFHLFPRKYLFIGGLFFSGIVCYSLPFCKSYASLAACTGMFGFFCGTYIGVAVSLFADTYTPDKVALAYSISSVFGGFMALGGPPLIGYILEVTGSYLICQLILGSSQFIASAVWLLEPWALKCEERRKQKKKLLNVPEEHCLLRV